MNKIEYYAQLLKKDKDGHYWTFTRLCEDVLPKSIINSKYKVKEAASFLFMNLNLKAGFDYKLPTLRTTLSRIRNRISANSNESMTDGWSKKGNEENPERESDLDKYLLTDEEKYRMTRTQNLVTPVLKQR